MKRRTKFLAILMSMMLVASTATTTVAMAQTDDVIVEEETTVACIDCDSDPCVCALGEGDQAPMVLSAENRSSESEYAVNIGKKATFNSRYLSGGSIPVSANPENGINWDKEGQLFSDEITSDLVVEIEDVYDDGQEYWYKVKAADGHTLPDKLVNMPWIFQNYIGYAPDDDSLIIDHNSGGNEGGEETDDSFPEPPIEYGSTTANGVTATVFAPKDAFGQDVAISVQDTTVDEAEVNSAIANLASELGTALSVLGISAVDVNFGGEQPNGEVILQMKIPEDKIPANANMVVILHFGQNGVEVETTKYLNNDAGETISVMVDGFSSYAAVFVNGKYNAQKLRDVLAANSEYGSKYSIVEFPVDIFDYDPQGINDSLNAATSDDNGFHFTGYGIAGCASNNGINNSEAAFAKQGIVSQELDEATGMPIIQYLNSEPGENAGLETGKILFDDTTDATGKTIYKDIPFEFVYDNQTGFYEYKSSANHAQLNDAKNKVELYADTLSTQNIYSSTLDLSTASGISDYTNVTAETTFKATTVDGGTQNRLDPYVVFKVDDVKASEVDQIYVKAKIPAAVGKNQMQVFFTTDKSTGWDEVKSNANGAKMGEENYKVIDYTATGDWIEFVIDTDDIVNWKDTITALRIDLFDSNKGNLAVNGNYTVEIDQISFIKKNEQYATYGGYYPFSDIRNSYPGNNTGFSLSEWSSLMQESNLATAVASRSIGNPSKSTINNELAYGMAMEFDFYIPVDTTGMEKDLTYYFNGDDDLWVYVDNQLVLDIGGGHGAITGMVNFTNGKVEVENAITVNGYNSNNGDEGKKTTTLNEALTSPGRHTLKVFFLERGGSVSNCYMKFNLPQTPTGDVVVSKEVEEIAQADTTVLDQEAFTFNISTDNLGAEPVETFTALAAKDFYIVNRDGTTSDAKTDANGNFTLRDGEEAVFNIDENYAVKVVETVKEVKGYENEGTTVAGVTAAPQSGTEMTQTTVKNKTINFDFVNKYDEIEKKITYVPVNPENCPDSLKGKIKLTGSDSATSDPAGISETVGVRVGDPKGSTAIINDAVKFVGWYSNPECTDLVTPEFVIDFTKENAELWTEKTYYAKFELAQADMIITKIGAQSIDTNQVFRFNIKGTSLNTKKINFDIVLDESNTWTEKIKSLPVGTYTVTELTDWSWRYDAQNASIEVELKTVDPTTGAVTVQFENTRTEDLWLSGDSYKRNWFENKGGNA